MKNNQKYLLIVIIVICLLAWGGYKYLLLNNKINNQQDYFSPTSTKDEMANWKTYTNTQYGFEFQYPYKNISVADGYVSSVDPKGMVAVVDMFTIPHGQDRDGEVRIFDLPLNEAAQSVGFGSDALSSAKTISRNGIKWTIIYAPEGNVYGHNLTEKNGKTFWIDADNSKISTSDFEAILNNFKFTK